MPIEELESYFRYVTSRNGFVTITLNDLMMHPEFESTLSMCEELIASGIDKTTVRTSFTIYVMQLAVDMWCDMRSHVGNFMGMTIWC